MITLNYLKSNFTLIASFTEASFVVFNGEPANRYRRPNKALLFYDDAGSYYLYTYIRSSRILYFTDLFCAYQRFVSFVETMLIV